MIKLLIADDEPLVLVGMQSMLDWAALGVEVCATAHNGRQALQLIEQHHPDLVITDIKMPLMSGLELAAACHTDAESLPLFIILTSYEEFDFVREAMHVGAIEYMVKLEMTPQKLRAVVERAVERITKMKEAVPASFAGNPGGINLQSFEEKFFARLYNNLFESPEQFRFQAEDLKLDFSAPVYGVAACEIVSGSEMPTERQITLCASTVQMVRDTLEKFGPCTVTTLDMRHFHVMFPLSAEQAADTAYLPRLMRLCVDTIQRYFSTRLRCGIGAVVSDPFLLAEAAHSARCMLALAADDSPIVDAAHCPDAPDTTFDISQFRSELARAFDELDAAALHGAITGILERLTGHPSRHVQARDAASLLLYLTLTLLPDGEKTLSDIFSNTPDGYRSIYKYTGTSQCCLWMEQLRDGLCEKLRSEHKNYKHRIVESVTQYIRQNLDRRLSLNEVAAVFSLSPSYLSQLFAKYAEHGFVETITKEKIAAAKTMLAGGELKIYEIAERLGYESAFYFSKVFKKEAGQSPREYMQQQMRR